MDDGGGGRFGDQEEDDAGEDALGPLGLVGPPSTTTKRSSGDWDGSGSGTGADADDVKAVFAHVDLDAFYAQVAGAPFSRLVFFDSFLRPPPIVHPLSSTNHFRWSAAWTLH